MKADDISTASKKQAVTDALDFIKNRIGEISNQEVELGLVVMTGVYQGGNSAVSGDVVGDMRAVELALLNAISDFFAKSYIINKISIKDSIQQLIDNLQSGDFTKRTMQSLEDMQTLLKTLMSKSPDDPTTGSSTDSLKLGV